MDKGGVPLPRTNCRTNLRNFESVNYYRDEGDANNPKRTRHACYRR